ncbi:MAG: RluA family pseudouridine synthase [Butyrivibrio sp.]|nr:RluA family pseudouridine synthase [Butyrivibrio sp.]
MRQPSNIRLLEHTVLCEEDGMNVRLLMKGVLHMSAKEITRSKQFDDGVLVRRAASESEDFQKAFVREILHEGDILRIKIYEDTENATVITPNDLPIDIVYEDEDIIVLNKLGDMVVHPSYAHPFDSLSNALVAYYERTGQEHVLRAIGRLDRETSGLILFAKNRHSAAVLSRQSEGMSRRKEYHAYASGVFERDFGTVDAPIGLPDGVLMKRKVMEDGKAAVTHYRVEKQYKDYALIRLLLDTGRTHQIRVHMAHLGHPLIGDSLYGASLENYGMKRAALHASHLEFFQPVTGMPLCFDVDFPEDMKRLCF